MVPFDDKSPFVTSGIRVGTPAITTRGLVEEDMDAIVDLIDRVIMDHTNEEVIEQVANEVNEMMSERAIFVSKIKLVIPFLKSKVKSIILTFDFSFIFSILTFNFKTIKNGCIKIAIANGSKMGKHCRKKHRGNLD
jgi:hypothetical protein